MIVWRAYSNDDVELSGRETATEIEVLDEIQLNFR